MNNNVKGISFAVIAAILWGASGTFGQFLFQQKEINVEWLISVRMLISGICLLIYASIAEKENILSIWKNKSDSINLLLFSTTGMLAVQYTYFLAIKHSNAATATVLQYAGPIVIAIYLAIRNRRPPTLKEMTAIFMAVAGTFLLVTHGKTDTLTISGTALFYGLASAVALAIYTLQPAELLSKHKASVVVGWGMLCGGIACSFLKAPWVIEGIWDADTLIGTLFVVILGTLIPFYLYLTAVNIVGGQRASLLASAEPLSATILAFFWLKISLTGIDIIGSILIISTIFILSMRSEKKVLNR